MTEYIGKVVKVLAGKYWVRKDGVTKICSARGLLRLGEKILVGDIVKVSLEHNTRLIKEVLPRENYLVRPPVANVDSAAIIVAYEPIPDLFLIDKIIVNCYSQNIEPIICYNKSDLASLEEINDILKVYAPYMKTLSLSAITREGLEDFLTVVKDKNVVMAGQSAVGKTSLLNSLLDLNLETGELSKKIRRGRNTTRHVEIYELFGANIVDTCGFNLLDMIEVHENEIALYYPDFLEYTQGCKFKNCTHTKEPECLVKIKVEEGIIDKFRYERYLKIYSEVKGNRLNKY